MSRLLSPLRRSSLGIKLAALGAVVTAAVVTVAFLGLGVEIRKETRQSFAAELSRNQRTLQQLEAYDASQLLFAASLITETPSLQYDLSIYRVEANAGGRARTDLVNTMERELRERFALRGKRSAHRNRRFRPGLRVGGDGRRRHSARYEPVRACGRASCARRERTVG
jgi:FtsZ-binding cell division protein ZapB